MIKHFTPLCLIFGITLSYSQVFVSNNGNNENGNGTQNNPYATIEYAINNLGGNNEIIIEEGVYNITNSINLTSSQNNITIRGCGNTILNGGLVLDNTTLPANDPTTNIFSSYPPSNPLNLGNDVTSNIVVVDLAVIGLTATDLGTMTNHGYGIDNGEFETPSVLWIDEEKMTLARFPNKNQEMTSNQMIMTSDWEAIRPKMKGQISYSEIKQKSAGSNGGIKYSVYSDLQSRVSSWSHHKNSVKDKIWVDGVFNSSWEWEYNQVETIDTNGDITLKYEPNTTNFNLTNGISDKTKISHFYFENVAEELDEEGEYFIDRDKMKLYFYAPNDYQNKQITLSTLNSDLIKISGADGITIKNITIQSGKKNAYRITNSNKISIENNTIRYFNQWAAKIDGTNNTVTSCEIYGLGGGGIQLGIENGQDYNLTRENNKVDNCEIYNFAWDQKSQIPGVSLHGCGNMASNNEIYNGTHFAVKLRHARLSKVLNNRIHDLPTYHHFDGGAVYLGLGRKFHNRANEINNNYLYDIPTNGIYLDNYTNGSYANNNVFYNVGNSTFDKNFAAIYNHGGGQNSYENNIAIDCSVIIKTGSHIVKNGNTQAYFNDWYDTYHSSGFQAIKNNYSNAVAETILAQTDTDWFMSALNNLPQDVDDFFKNYSTSDSEFNTIWNANKDNWDELGYLHTIAQDNANDPTQLQWRNYFLLRYCKSSINNNLGLYTDNDVFDADNNKSAIKNEGDNKVFWEYSPYIAVDNSKHSNHEASNNEKLNVSETNLAFGSLVSNNSLSGSSITFSASSSNLQNDLNNTFSATVDLNLLNNLPVCVQQTCNFNLKTAEAKADCNPYNASSLTYSITIPFENGGNNQNINLSTDLGSIILRNDYNSDASGNIKITDIPLGQSPTLTGGTSCNSNSINYTFNIAPDCNYFIGSDSNKWQIDANWSSGTVPSDTSHAIIPDLTYTGGKENCLLPNGNSDVGSLTIEAKAEVNINKSSTLTIKENLFVNDNGLLLIRSNGGSVTPGHGNLIVLGESTGDVRYDLFVQDYTKTSLVSPPVAGQTFADFASNNNNLYANPDKPNQKLFGPYEDAKYLAWHKETDGLEEIQTGTGYRAAVKIGTDKLLHFIGNVNTNTVNLNFSSLNTDGWHLIGNPYTSGIDLKKFIDTNINDGNLENLTSAVYGWDADDSDITGSKWTIVTKNDQKIIPPGQGFFVKPSNNKTIVFKPSMQNIHNGGGFIQRNTNNTTQSFYVSLTADSKKTATKVYLNNEASTGLDQGYDVTAKNDIGNFGIYTVLANGENSTPLAVQTIPLNTVYDIIIPLGVVSDEKEIEIKAEEINVNNDIDILIEDIQNNSWLNLKKETLKVSYTNSDLNEIRFKIHFSTKNLDIQNHENPAIRISKDQNFIKVEDPINRKLNLRILDNYGRLILDKKFHKNQKKIIKVDHLPSGIYFLNVYKDNLNIIKKIIL